MSPWATTEGVKSEPTGQFTGFDLLRVTAAAIAKFWQNAAAVYLRVNKSPVAADATGARLDTAGYG
ncbi:predicted protein [Streptomyces sp. C]|nr:predicted protein [Streptomyces sp. C]